MSGYGLMEPGAHLRRTVREPINPLDKSTIISISPMMIDDVKHTIQPSRYIIPSGSYEKPSLTIIEPASWWKQLNEEEPLLEITVSSINLAESIVRDFCQSLFACGYPDVMPGIFHLPGVITAAELKFKPEYKSLIELYKERQDRWYMELVKEADSLWARSNGNPLAISDTMRMAAKELQQNDKDWLQNYQLTQTIRCVACGVLRNPQFPICANCKTNIPEFIKSQGEVVASK